MIYSLENKQICLPNQFPLKVSGFSTSAWLWWGPTRDDDVPGWLVWGHRNMTWEFWCCWFAEASRCLLHLRNSTRIELPLIATPKPANVDRRIDKTACTLIYIKNMAEGRSDTCLSHRCSPWWKEICSYDDSEVQQHMKEASTNENVYGREKCIIERQQEWDNSEQNSVLYLVNTWIALILTTE